jgi:hypothetical protein
MKPLKTVAEFAASPYTPLKQGVNERCSPKELQKHPGSKQM